MAITYGASAGIGVTSPIVYETLGSQSGAAANEVILATSAVTPSTHANYAGDVGDASTGTGPGDTYIGRLLCVREGTATEEVKMCVAETDNGATITLQVNENWNTPPVSSEVLSVSYTMDDLETGGTAGAGISYTTRSGQFILSNKLVVGNGTDFALIQLGPAESLEINDSGGSTDPDLEIVNNGMFCSGYLFLGVPVNGGYITSDQDDTEQTWSCESGGFIRCLDTDLKIDVSDIQLDFQAGSDVIFNGVKNYQFTYGSNLFGSGSFSNVKWIGGLGGVNDYVYVAEEITIDTWNLVSTGGFNSEPADTSTESITLKDVIFINNFKYISLNSNKTYYAINPVWGATIYTDFTWDTSTANYVYDQRSVEVTVQTAAGSALQNAMIIIYEGTILDDLVVESATDVNGKVDTAFTYKLHSTNSSTVTYGTHAFRVDKWLYSPFIATQTSTESRTGVVTLITDSAIVQTTQATALSDGSGITWNEDANPSSVIDYTAGSGTLLVGMILTGGTSGAVGTVTQIVSGDSAAGEVHLESRDGTAFTPGGESISRTGGTAGSWSATVTAASQQDFSIWIDGNSKSQQTIYDYFAALTSETTLSATGELVHEWGRDSQGRAFYSGADGFYTERSNGKGIFIVNYGGGTLEYYTEDDGGTWTPPTSVDVIFHAVDKADVNIEGCQVSAYLTSDDSEVILTDTNASGLASTTFTKTTPAAIYYRYRKASPGDTKYINISGTGTIESGTGLSVKRAMTVDTNNNS